MYGNKEGDIILRAQFDQNTPDKGEEFVRTTSQKLLQQMKHAGEEVVAIRRETFGLPDSQDSEDMFSEVK